MPAAKTHRRQLKLAAINKTTRTATRSRVAAARTSIESDAKSDATAASVKDALRELDRAASKGVVHPNNAARRKSRLMRQRNKARAAASS